MTKKLNVKNRKFEIFSRSMFVTTTKSGKYKALEGQNRAVEPGLLEERLEVIEPRILSEEKESGIRPSLYEMLAGQVEQADGIVKAYQALHKNSAQMYTENQAFVIKNAELTVKLRDAKEQEQAIGDNSAQMYTENQAFVIKNAELTVKLRDAKEQEQAIGDNSAQMYTENQAFVIKNAELTVKLRDAREQGQAIGDALPEHQQDTILQLAEVVLEKEVLQGRIIEFEENASRAEQKRLELEESNAKTPSYVTRMKLRNHVVSATVGALATGLLFSLYNRDRVPFSAPVIGVGLETPPATGGVVNNIDGPELTENTTLLCLFRGSKTVYKLVRQQIEKD
jgi:uncharacterized protein YeeX (DUF496 family)